MSYEVQFLVALLTTTIVEVPVAAFVAKKLLRSREVPLRRLLFVATLASALTLPYFWFVLPAFVASRALYLIGGEVAITLVEALLYKELLEISWKRAVVISLCANVTSIIVGLLLF